MKSVFTFFFLALISISLDAQHKPLLLEKNQEHQRIGFTLSSPENSISLCNLDIEDTYKLIINSTYQQGVGAKIYLADSNEPPSHTLTFNASSSCEEIFFTFENTIKKERQLTLSISLLNNKKRPKTNDKELLSSITTTVDGNAAGLIRDVFIGGDCFDVAGTSFSGSGGQLGSFANGTSSINIEEGVIISTGNIGNSAGPNTSQSITTGYGAAGSDSDLDAISGGGNLFDIGVIEFDFTPTESFITFEYAFASDEYCEYAGTEFNDVFGFFLSGPGINGPYSNDAINIAIVPGTGDNVSINSVNHYTNTGFYQDNSITEGCASGSPVAPNDIEYDGFTVVLTAIANVTACETYHIKLIIADRGDAIFDSAVFLKANSFGGDIDASVASEITGEAASAIAGYEGCSDAVITFTRVGDDLSQDVLINYVIAGSSTATPGLDYSPLPPVIIIPAGETSVTITINIFDDLIIEGMENIYIVLDKSCSCTTSYVEVQILEPPPLEVVLADLEICRGALTTLTPSISGGIPPYSYLWENGSTAESIDVQISDPTSFSVTVSDNCHSAEATVFNLIPTFPSAVLSGERIVCQGNDINYLDLELTGDAPWSLTYSVNGQETTITDIQFSPYPLVGDEVGIYTLVSVASADGCPGEVFGEGELIEEVIDVIPAIDQITCFGMDDGAVQLAVTGGAGPYDYDWNNGLPDEEDIDNLSSGTYTVTVTDVNGCKGTIETVIEEPDELFGAADVSNIDCANTLGNIMAGASGGTAPYSYVWEDGSNTSNQDSLSAGMYLFTITDDAGCEAMMEANIEDSTAYPDVLADVEGELNCYSNITIINAQGSSSANLNYQWLAPDSTILSEQGQSISVSLEGIYTLIVTDTTNSCVTETNAEVILNDDPPLAEAGDDATLNCDISNVWLDASSANQGTGMTYQWTTPDGNIIEGADSLFALIDAPGTYVLSVLNPQNGCDATDNILINEDIAYPNITLQNPATLDCESTALTLTSTGSDIGTTFNYEWTTTNGLITSTVDSASVSVNAAGTYALEIINTINGCASSMDVLVPIDTLSPFADAGDDIELDCLGTAVSMNGDASNGPNYTYEWQTADGAILSGAQTLSPQTSVAGTYTLLVTNTLNGCSTSDQNTVLVNSGALSITASADDILNCYNADVQINSEILQNNPNYTSIWTDAQGNEINAPQDLSITVDAPGTYSVQITNLDNGCISIASAAVNQDIALPIALAGYDQLVNCYESLATLDASDSDTASIYTIQWTNPDGSTPSNSNDTQLETPLSGTFTLTVLNTENGCISSDEVDVEADFTLPESQAGVDMTLNCLNDSVLLNGFVDADGHTYEFQWEDLQNNTILSATALSNYVNEPGYYTLSVLDTENGCTANDTLEILLDIEPPVAGAEVYNILDCDNISASLSSDGSSQGSNISYEWTYLNQNAFLSNNHTQNVSSPGDYQLMVTNTINHCISTSLVTVNQDIEVPLASIAPPATITCTDLVVNLDASGSSTGPDYLYQWTLPDGNTINQTENATFDATAAGLYVLEVVNTTNGCENQASIEVESLVELPTVEAGPAQLINCFQPEVVLNPQGSTTGSTFLYEWYQNGISVNQSATLEALPVDLAGTYELFITNTTNDCRSSDIVMVDIDISPPIAEAGDAMMLNCSQNSLTLDGSQSSTGNVNYQWTSINGTVLSGENSQTPLISSPGTYTLFLTNLDNGCQSTDQVEVEIDTLHPQIQILPTEILTCSVTSVVLEGNSNGNYNYNWLNENDQIIGNTTSIAVQNAGSYQFVATNLENECQSAQNIQVVQNIEVPVAEAGGDATLTCTTTSFQLDGTLSSGNSTYEWTTPNGNIQSGSTGQTPIITAPGIYTIHVVDNFNDCEAWDQVTIDEDVEIPIALAAPNGMLTCINTSVELQATSNVGLNLEYEWQTAAGQSINQGNLNATTNLPGTFQFSVYNPANGCENNATVVVEQDIETPVVEAGEADDLTCITTSLPLGASVSSVGGAYNLTWTGPTGGIIANANTLSPLVQTAGTYTLQITNEENGCSSSDDVAVVLIAPVAMEAEIQQPLCHGDPAFLEVQNIVGGVEPYLYSINGGGSFVQNDNFTLLSPGWHLVVIQDANGCEFAQGVEMIDIPELVIEMEALSTIKLGESYQVNATVNIPETEIASIIWTPADSLSCQNCLDPLAAPYVTTEYLLQVIDQNGCIDQAPLRLVVDKRPAIYIPNVFSPNADGTNELFYIFAKDNTIKNINSLQIFSRWGEMVFEVYNIPPNDPQWGWDGDYRETPMNSAVFTYWTEIELINGEIIIMKGDVTIAR